MSKYIEIELLPDGAVRCEAFGYSGKECERVIGELLEGLGVEVSEGKHKSEYYEVKGKQRVTQKG